MHDGPNLIPHYSNQQPRLRVLTGHIGLVFTTLARVRLQLASERCSVVAEKSSVS